MPQANADFYVVGGALGVDASSYVSRRADVDLYENLSRGRFCYVLTSRQIGKSSLMVRTAARLRADGRAVAVVDLTAIGQNLTVAQWYGSLLGMIGEELGLEDDLAAFWDEHGAIGPLRRATSALRDVVLERVSGQVVVFIDEIDAVRSLPFSTDELFAAIRELYSRRTSDAALERLAFCLIGVATPSDLIQDPRTTPFNVGERVDLTDFTAEEARPLAAGFGRGTRVDSKLLARVLHWTGGHPYLTQRLCRAIAEDPSVTGRAGVDRLCRDLFIAPTARERDDNLVFVRDRMLEGAADRAGLLDLYAKVRRLERVRDDAASPLVRALRLSGIVRAVDGFLRVRNRIYSAVFDRAWVRVNMPDAELARQRAAYRKGMVRTAAAAAVAIAVVGGLAVFAETQRTAALDARREALAQRNEAVAARQEAERQQTIAESRKLDAERERANAEAQSRWAMEQRGVAERQRAEADAQRRRALEQQGIAEREQSTNRELLYVAQLNVAQEAWETADVMRVLELLEEQRPKDGERDLRGFEWYYLSALARGGVTLPVGSDATSVSFSPDGRTLAVGTRDGSVHLKSTGGATDHMLEGHAGSVTSVAFSPEGSVLATAGRDRTVRLWSVQTGRITALFEGHATAVNSVAFSPDGRHVASGSDDNTVRVWDVVTGLARTLEREELSQVTSVAFSPEGTELAVGSLDAGVLGWDLLGGGVRAWGPRTMPPRVTAMPRR